MPPRAYGGIELVVHLLTESLVRRGHDVTLFATGDSSTSARLASVTERPRRYGDPNGLRHPEYVQLANAQACFRAAAAGRFDVVHNHAGIEGLVLAATSDTPVVTTCHHAWEPETAPVWDAYPWFHVALSGASAGTFPERGRLAPVHNAIDVASYRFAERGRGYLLFLGRLAPEKDPAAAIEIARRTARPLVLAGKIDPRDQAYAEATVLPQIDDDRIRWVGEVDAVHKRDLLAGADALLFPIRWEEPFGLVMIEALAAGTPVVALRQASVPEVVEDGVTGFVADDVDEMAAAVCRIGEIDRRRCRDAAERRFDVERMTDAYLDRYQVAIASGAVAGPASA